ncbi:MAG: dienelactone hydrolase family protein [Pseudoxanthomonas sp.]
MSHWITLHTAAGPVQAWLAEPASTPRGGLVVIQEIFGANAHIRSVADRYAAEGWLAIAPAFFDPVEKNVELPYDPASFARGRELVAALGFERALQIVQAAAAQVSSAGKVGTVGYCWGGSVVLRAAQTLGLPGVSYYGTRNVGFLDVPLQAPVMFHFGEKDASIPPDAIQAHREKLPTMDVFVYPAEHAFNRDVDPTHHDAASAKLAWQRSLQFLREHAT